MKNRLYQCRHKTDHTEEEFQALLDYGTLEFVRGQGWWDNSWAEAPTKVEGCLIEYVRRANEED